MFSLDGIKSFFGNIFSVVGIIKSIFRWLIAKAIDPSITTDIDSVNFTPRTMWEMTYFIFTSFIIIGCGYFLSSATDNYQKALNTISRLEKNTNTLNQTVKVLSESNKKLEEEIEALKLENKLILKLKAQMLEKGA